MGKVISIQERTFGSQEPATYAQLYFKRDELTMTMLREDLPNMVRTLVTPKEAREILAQIKSWKGEAKSQWKSRADAHQAAIEGGDPFEYAKVAKELSKMEVSDTLRIRDKQHLNQSLDLLTEELARALKKTQGQARKMIEQAISA